MSNRGGSIADEDEALFLELMCLATARIGVLNTTCILLSAHALCLKHDSATNTTSPSDGSDNPRTTEEHLLEQLQDTFQSFANLGV
jgi:hypothetical protein